MKKKTILLAVLFIILLLPVPALAEMADIQNHWAKKAVEQVVNDGIMRGTQKGFEPERGMTRAELAVCLNKLFALDYGDKRFFKQPEVSDYYTDVPGNAWYAEAALYLAINDISFSGDRQFGANQPVTRIEAATAMVRCFNAKKLNIPVVMMLPIYKDIPESAGINQSVIGFISNTGIMKGFNGSFYPNRTLKRAEAAVCFVRINEIIKQNASEDEGIAE